MPTTRSQSISALLARLRGDGHGARLARGAAAFFVLNAAANVIALTAQVALGRGLGIAEYGTYSWSYRWMMLLLVAARLGFDTGALRYVAGFVSTGDHAALRGFLRLSARWITIASLGLSALVVASTLVGGARLSPTLCATLIATAVALPIHAHLQQLRFVLRGFKLILPALLPAGVLAPLLLAVAVFAVTSAGFPLSAAGAMGLNAIAGGIALVVSWVILRRVMPEPTKTADVHLESRAWARTCAPLLFVSLLTHLLARVDVIVLGLLGLPAEVGLYVAATQISQVIPFGLRALESWASPNFASLFAERDFVGLRRLAHRGARLNLGFTIPVSVVVIFLAKPLLGLFGRGFEEAWPILIVLAIGQIADALTGPASVVLTMTGGQMALARLIAGHAIAATLLSYLLVWLADGYDQRPLGAAIAVTLVRVSYRVFLGRRTAAQLKNQDENPTS